jgi:hypothetical protein
MRQPRSNRSLNPDASPAALTRSARRRFAWFVNPLMSTR